MSRYFTGFIFKFGQDYVRDYDDVNFNAVNIIIIREIRDKSLCVRGYDLCNINVVVHSLYT